MIWIEYHPKWVKKNKKLKNKKRNVFGHKTYYNIGSACYYFFEDTATMYTFFKRSYPKKTPINPFWV